MSWGLELLDLLLTIMLFGLAFLWSILTGFVFVLIFGVWWDKKKSDKKSEEFEWQTEEKLKDGR